MKKTEERKNKALQIYSKLQDGKDPTEPSHQSPCSKFEDSMLSSAVLLVYAYGPNLPVLFMIGYAVWSAEESEVDFLAKYCILSQDKLSMYKRAFEAILELVDFRVTEGLTDLRLFAVVASLAQKIATL
ncbi:hypothetical protein cypCar_00016080, partial [Cyprinus carpio]